ncbi:hypothetical protein [Nannocystis pusilla]|uniref:hypothetical protein n=1 Tax=Nannocystis pusilla TaxID=889268 RepID=UPI003B784F3D
MLHHFEELPVDPYLVTATELTYSENPTATLLTAARHRGYVYSSGAYSHKAYPPVEFTYSAAQIDPTLRLVDADTSRRPGRPGRPLRARRPRRRGLARPPHRAGRPLVLQAQRR